MITAILYFSSCADNSYDSTSSFINVGSNYGKYTIYIIVIFIILVDIKN